MSKLNIAVDVMGADLGPAAIIEGALMAKEMFPDVALTLVGKQDLIEKELERLVVQRAGRSGTRVEMAVIHAPDVIEMHEVPTDAIRRKKESSIVVGLKAVKEGKAHGFVSAGSTGALLTGATVHVGREPGIERPALATVLPTPKGHMLLLDCGANMDCKPSYLMQFGQIGTAYMKRAMGITNPRVGLVNVGAEKEKGNAAAKEAHLLLEGAGLNFTGNIEGREILSGDVDVAVCDGFTGNILLKHTEGFAKIMMGMIKEELMAGTLSKLGALMSKSAFGRLKKRFDHREVGGAPFLGLKSLVIKAHGSSDALAIKNAIRQCVEYSNSSLT